MEGGKEDSNLSHYLVRGYQQLSFAKRLWNWVYYQYQIPRDTLIIHFTNTTDTKPLTSSVKN